MNTHRPTPRVIACTLGPNELRETRLGWERLLRVSLLSREEIPGGLRLSVHPGSAEALRQLIDVERECCRWISFELEGPVVTMTSPGEGEQVIRQMWPGVPKISI